MHQQTTINSHDDLLTTTKEEQTRRTILHKTTNDIRAKSVDYPRRTSPMVSSFDTRSTIMYVDELHRKTEEKHGLTILNNRFENYLNQIKILADININLRHKIDDINQKYMENIKEEKQIDNKNSNSLELEFNNLRRQLNIELKQLISFQIRFQRADYDKKYYRNKLKFFSKSDQSQINKQQLDADLEELNLLKEQYEKQLQDLQLSKKQYKEYTARLIEYTNEYHSITYERMLSENYLHTLKEQISFECEYNQRCKQEFEYLEKIQYDSNKQFNKTEFDNAIQKIREDYRQYNQIQLSQLEISYKIKFESIQKDFHKNKKENQSEETKQLMEQNRSLEQKLKQLENDRYHIITQNREQYDKLNDEYNQLKIQLSELESFILNSRNNTVHLTSEIDTYRCLLINLVHKTKSHYYIEQIAGFAVHHENGIIWIRI